METVLASIIGATVALLTLAWQQWLTRVQSRHDLLRTKLEELCTLLVSIRGRTTQAVRINSLPTAIDKQKELVEEIQGGIVDELLRIQMLQSLYFTKLKAHVGRILTAGFRVVGSREHFTREGQTKEVHPLVNAQHFRALAVHSEEMLDYINLEFDTLTETPRSFFSWRMGD